MEILVIDGQGGRVGRLLVEAVRKNLPDATVIAVGTNAMATETMLKASPQHCATGENAVIVCSRSADLIIGPIGIVLADSLFGEITPAMAAAVGASRARKLLIPFNQCNTRVVGCAELSMTQLLEETIQEVCRLKDSSCPTLP